MPNKFIQKHRKKLIAGAIGGASIATGILFRKQIGNQIASLNKIYDEKYGKDCCPVKKQQVIQEIVREAVLDPVITPTVVNIQSPPERPEFLKKLDKRMSDREQKKEIDKLQLQRIREHQLRLKNIKHKVDDGKTPFRSRKSDKLLGL
jgi:hypothetical protein